MKIHLSTIENIAVIMEIINEAKIHLATHQIDQWQNGYPNSRQIEQDILKRESYVVVNYKNEIIATSMFTTSKEPTYKGIEGKWIVDEDETYGVVHRMAIRKKYRKLGIATFLFDYFHLQLKEKGIQSLKIDTHEDNHRMKALVEKLGYQFCGTIYTEYGAKRDAFEKVLFF